MSKSKLLTLKDENGKVFETSVETLLNKLSVSDLEEGCSLDVYDSEVVRKEFPGLAIVDSEGKPFDITRITDAEEQKKIVALDVLIEVTHSGMNANDVVYYSDSMEKDAASFISPYAKPFIKNHDSYSEPLGRVTSAYFGASDLVERDTINAVFRVTDEDAIPKFLDKRYQTVSIGGHPSKITCDICGKDILKDGVFKFCGHWKGETYANKKATWSMRDIAYNEVSVVNNPADKWAQVKRITVIKADEKKNEDSKVGDAEVKNASKIIEDANKTLVDDILSDATKEGVKPVEDTQAEPETPAVEDNKEAEPVVEDTQEEPEVVKTVEDCEKTIRELTDSVTALTEEKETLTATIDSMKTEQIEVSDKLVTAEAESKVARDQSLRLAMKYKALLVDSIDTLIKVVKDDLKEEDWRSKSIKELGELADELKAKIPVIHATPTPAANPGVVDNKAPGVLPDEEKKQTTKTSLADHEVTMNDLIASATR